MIARILAVVLGLAAVTGLGVVGGELAAWGAGQEETDRRHGERISKGEAIAGRLDKWIGNEESRRALEVECKRVRQWCIDKGVPLSECPLSGACP